MNMKRDSNKLINLVIKFVEEFVNDGMEMIVAFKVDIN